MSSPTKSSPSHGGQFPFQPLLISPNNKSVEFEMPEMREETHSDLAISVSYLHNLHPYKSQNISACLLLRLLRFEIFLSGVSFSYFWVLSKINFSFDLLSLLLLCPEAHSVSEIIENCMRKASLLPWYDPDVSLWEGVRCYLVRVIKNPRTENKDIFHLHGSSQGLIPQLVSSDSSENLFLIAQKSLNKEKDYKKIRKEVVVLVLAIWSLQDRTRGTVLLLFTFLSM